MSVLWTLTSHTKKQKTFLLICWLTLGLTDADLNGFHKAPMKKSTLLLLATSECFHWLRYLQCQCPLCQSSNTINHPKHILMRIYLLKHQFNIRTTNELSENYSENQCHIHIECNPWICAENPLNGFYFKITLTGNELSITNHEVHGFSNSF